METKSIKYKRGDAHPENPNLVFLGYDKTMRNGQHWGTAEKLEERRAKARESARRRINNLDCIKYRQDYNRLQSTKDRHNKQRNTGVGRGRGKRKDARTEEQAKKYNLEWKKERRKTDLNFKLSQIIRGAVRRGIARNGKRFWMNEDGVYEKILGCTFSELRTYLETKFLPGMSWENHGKFGWHIDHIIPISSASTQEEIIKLNSYKNLQPLWWKDNLKKWANK